MSKYLVRLVLGQVCIADSEEGVLAFARALVPTVETHMLKVENIELVNLADHPEPEEAFNHLVNKVGLKVNKLM